MIKTLPELYDFLCDWNLMDRADAAYAERDIPAELPAVLRDFFRNAGVLTEHWWGHYGPLNGTHWTAGPGLFESDSRTESQFPDGFVDVVLENQGNWRAGIASREDDPPVWCSLGMMLGTTGQFEIAHPKLSEFLISHCLLESVNSAQFVYEQGPDPFGDFRVPCTALWTGTYLTGETVRIFRIGDALMSMDGYATLIGRNQDGLADLVAPHVGWQPGDWLLSDNSDYVRPRPSAAMT
jgi:hypothetical protein